MTDKPSSHHQLLDGCRRNDRLCQNLLYDKYKKKVLGICLRYARDLDQAKDIQQESFIKVFQSLSRQMMNIDSFDAWISRITINTAIDYFRKEKMVFELRQSSIVIDSNEPEILSKLRQDDLILIIQSIPLPYRIVFNLYVIDGYSHREIAKILTINESTSRSYLTRARDSIKEIFQKQDTLLKNLHG